MSNVIAELKARLSFDLDDRKLKEFERKLQNAHRRLNDVGQRTQKNIQRTTGTQLRGLTAVEKRLDGQRGKLYQLRQDYFRVNQEYHRGNLSYERRARMLNDINQQYRTQRQLVRDTNRAVRQQPVRRVAAALNRPIQRPSLPGTTQPVQSGTNAVTAGATGGAIMAAASRFMAPVAAVAAPAGAYAAANASNKQFQNVIRLLDALTSTLGDVDLAEDQINRLYDASNYLGQQFMGYAQSFRRFQNSFRNTELFDRAEDLYFDVQTYFTASGMDQTQIESVTRVMSQAASAGVLQADALNSLADAGISRAVVAKALGITLEELNQRASAGELVATETLPLLIAEMAELAERGGALERRRTSTEAEQNRRANQSIRAHTQANMAGIDAFINEITKGFQKVSDKMLPALVNLGEAFGQMAEPTGKIIEEVANLIGILQDFNGATGHLDIIMQAIVNGLTLIGDSLEELNKLLQWVADVTEAIENRSLPTDIGTRFVDAIVGILEDIVNQVITEINRVTRFVGLDVPKVNWREREQPDHYMPVVDLSGVDALLGNIDQTLQMEARKKTVPIIFKPLVVHDPAELPFGDPEEMLQKRAEMLEKQATRNVETNNTNHYSIESPVTINVDGYNQDPNELADLIEEGFESHINRVIRSASMQSTVEEQ